LPLARELAERQVGVLYAYGDEAIAAAQIATGFVESLARPGGNTTGVTCITTELSGKRVAVLHEMVPRLKRLAVLYNPEKQKQADGFRTDARGGEVVRRRQAVQREKTWCGQARSSEDLPASAATGIGQTMNP